MKTFYTLLLTIGVFISVFGQADNTQVTVKSFMIEQGKELLVNLGENVEIERWDKENVSVMTSIAPSNYKNTDKLGWLVSKGMFNIAAKTGDIDIELFYPLANRPIKINGAVLKHNVTYKIYVPKYMSVVFPEVIEETGIAKNEDF